MTLPDGWTTRRPTLDDIPAILAMVRASTIAATGEPDFSREDVRAALTAPNTDPERDSWLAMDRDSAVVGWTYLDNPTASDSEFVEVYAHPQRGTDALAPLLDRQLDRVAERAAEFGFGRLTVRAGAIPTERPWIAALRAAGFGFVKRHARMRRSLAGVSAVPPAPPAGVLVRPVRPSDEAELREFHRILDASFRDTPDYQPATYRQWRDSVAAQSSVAWDEWFVAAVDGAAVGILQSSDQALEQNEGWVKNLAVLRGHRHRGVGAALLGRAFACYAGKGRDHAGLGVDLANPTEAVRLYRSLGMTPVFEADIYERVVAAAGTR